MDSRTASARQELWRMGILDRGLSLGRRLSELESIGFLLRQAGLPPGTYGYPRLVRAGLGHSLTTWARCVSWCHRNEVPMLAPRWRHLRLGPYLRRELDKRAYHRLFRSDGYVNGRQRLLCLTLGRRVAEAQGDETLSHPVSKVPTLVVFYDGAHGAKVGHGLDSLRDDREVVTRALLRMTWPALVRESLIDTPFIGVHVRCGDFSAAPTSTDLYAGRRNVRTPVDWYAAALIELRRTLGANHLARVFSDGSEAELAPLRRLPRVEFMPNGSAITDILRLSQARVLLASGSGFSQWAAFLGQMPSMWFPKQRHYHLRSGSDGERLEVEWEPGGAILADFRDAVLANWIADSYLRERVPPR